ncbi:hypothetical protein VYU27_009974 [Nannochloropsis oceanica]
MVWWQKDVAYCRTCLGMGFEALTSPPEATTYRGREGEREGGREGGRKEGREGGREECPLLDGRPTRKTKTVTVDVPAGVETGVNIRMAGQGGEGAKGAPAGNLYLSIEVEEDPYFKRDGEDIHVEVPVNVAQAMLGATIDVLTLDGMVELKVSQGIQHDTMLLMRGRGVRELQGSRRGNQIVHIKIEVPKSLTAKQKELIQAFQEEEEAKMKKKEGGGGGGGRGGGFFAGGFQERVRDAYTRIKEFMGKKEKDRKGGKEEGKEGGKEGGKEKKTSTAGS